MFSHICRFGLLLLAMWALTWIPYGIYVNTALTLAAFWTLSK